MKKIILVLMALVLPLSVFATGGNRPQNVHMHNNTTVDVDSYHNQNQRQQQQQKQKQKQSVDIEVKNNNQDDEEREFAAPVQPGFPSLIPHYGGPNYEDLGPNFTSVYQILMINEYWTVKKAIGRKIDGWGDDPWDGMKVTCEALHDVPRMATHDTYPVIRSVLEKPKGDMVGYGICTIRATADDKTSTSIFKEGLRQTQGMGGNLMHVIAEGGTKELEAWGVGLGLGYVQADMNNNNRGSGVGSGGTGVNFAETHYETLPWVQFVVYHHMQ